MTVYRRYRYIKGNMHWVMFTLLTRRYYALVARTVLVLASPKWAPVEKLQLRTSQRLWIWMRRSTCSKGRGLDFDSVLNQLRRLPMTYSCFLRSMVEPLFTHEHVDKMRPKIQKTVDSLLENMLNQRSEKPIDLVEKFSLPVPSFVSIS
jgi:hypothetical protein